MLFRSNINSGTQVTFVNAGKYLITVETAFSNSTGSNPTVSIWIAQNGTNVANSAQDVQFFGGSGAVQYSSCTWIIDAAAGDYIQCYWSCSGTTVSLAAQGTLTNPTRPASPAATLSATQVMYTQLGPTGPTGPSAITVGTTQVNSGNQYYVQIGRAHV
mgnify:FL=1